MGASTQLRSDLSELESQTSGEYWRISTTLNTITVSSISGRELQVSKTNQRVGQTTFNAKCEYNLTTITHSGLEVSISVVYERNLITNTSVEVCLAYARSSTGNTPIVRKQSTTTSTDFTSRSTNSVDIRTK